MLSSSFVPSSIHFSDVRYHLGGGTPHNVIKSAAWFIKLRARLSFNKLLTHMNHLHQNSVVGIGDGVAVFDWIMDGIDIPYLFCATLEKPVFFNATDDNPVDIIVILISPQSEGAAKHLQYLARVTRVFRDFTLLARVRSVTNSDGLSCVLSDISPVSMAA